MRMDKLVQELHKKMGGKFSPFNLARYMEIEVSKHPLLGEVMGMYVAGGKRIFINSKVDVEMQEDVCLQLVTHYYENKDYDLWVTVDNFKPLMFRERFMIRVIDFMRVNRVADFIVKTIKSWKQKSSLV